MIAIFCDLLKAPQNFASETNSVSTGQTPDIAWSNILALRLELDKELQIDTDKSNSLQHAAVKEKIAKEARQLSSLAFVFTQEFPTNNHFLQAGRLSAYADVLHRMLQKEDEALLYNAAEYIPSCLYDSEISKQLSISMKQASLFQAAVESGFTDGAIAAMKIGPESFNGILYFIRRARTDAGKKLAQAVVDSPVADESLNQCARFVLNREFSVGQPLTIKFTALDGRQVDISKLHGKVVLVDFWATSCAPCMSQLPALQFFYQKFGGQGFEIVGISTDYEEKPLLRTIQDEEIPWPNYMDENGWTNKFAVACGVYGIPDYWLIDRRGIVREIMADSNLEQKIKYLLAEKVAVSQ